MTNVTGAQAGLLALGREAAWSVVFAPHAARGRRPARIVAVHREASIVSKSVNEHRARKYGEDR